jgi:hypothetical protein
MDTFINLYNREKFNEKDKKERAGPIFLHLRHTMGNIFLITGDLACFPGLHPDTGSSRSGRHGTWLGDGPPDYCKYLGMSLHYPPLYQGMNLVNIHISLD